MAEGKVVSITGIDTDIGKSIATGLLGRFLLQRGYKIITQKICQTGCVGFSEDVATHRKIMGMELQQVDLEGVTCPYIFAEPCSPHLAAKLEDRQIDLHKITQATNELRSQYDIVLLEGVGGLMVPLLSDITLVDYLRPFDYSHILVSCSRLGSINHTLSALEIIKQRKLCFSGIVYNRYMDSNTTIASDSKLCFKRYLQKNGLADVVVDMTKVADGTELSTSADFSPLLKNLGLE